MYKNKRVLLIAGGGALGSHTARELIRLGCTVEVICPEEKTSYSDRLIFHRSLATDELLASLFLKQHYDGIINFLHYNNAEDYKRIYPLLISNTDHLLIITKKGLIKKLPYKGENYDKATGYGSFAQYDYPIHRLVVNNHDSVMLFDSNGRYSCIPVHEIENTESSNPGNKIYNFTKLEGEIVSAYEYINRDMQDTVKDITNQTINIVTLSANGMIKKTDINEFTSLKSTKNVKAIRLKDDDKLAYAGLMFDTTKLLIYTKKGQFAFIKCDDIPLTSKDAIGNIAINLDSDDECVGCTSVGNDAEYLLVITEKGCAKKCEMEYLGDTKKRRQSSYITTLDHNDNVIYCDTITDESRVIVSTRTNYHVFNADDIRTASRKSKCNKLIPLPVGDNIVKVIIGE